MTARLSPIFAFVMVAVLAAWPLRGAAAEALRHDVKLRIAPDDLRIAVTDRIALSGQDEFRFILADWLHIRSVAVDGAEVQPDRSGTAVSVKLPGNGNHAVEITAVGTIPALDLADAGHRRGSRAVASADGIYLPGWENWLPNVPGSAEAYRLTIETPASHRATATGTLKTETQGDTENISVIDLDATGEPPSVFAGPYEVSESRSGPVRLRTYFPRSSAGLADDYLAAAARYIDLFGKQIGPYPFADFHIVAAPLPVGLGFRNLTYIDQRILRLPFMRGRSLAHEVLHNWWGNGVAADYSTGNWSEGLTTYMADHGLADLDGPERSREMRLAWLRDYAALPPERDIAVNRFVSKRHDAGQVVGYGKVAFIFHMLKHEIGADGYSAAMRRFWSRHKFRPAGWRDIRSAFEAQTQLDLGWYFDQWVERAGAPELQLEDVEHNQDDDQHMLAFTLVQATPAYRLSVPVTVTTKTGEERTTVVLDSERKGFQLQVSGKPVRLQIDPDITLFRRLSRGEAPPILRDVLLDKTARAHVLHDDPAGEAASRDLAARLLDTDPAALGNSPDPGAVPDVPLVVAGSAAQIDDFTAGNGLPPRPAELAGRGTARVWTARSPAGKAVLFIEAEDAAALRALLRPLPHYRSKSYIVFDGRRAIENGVWPLSEGPLSRRLE